MRRREFIAGLGTTAMGPFAARAQQSGMPVVGFLSTRSPNEAAIHTNAFRRGLEEMGYLEGRGVTAGDPAAQAAKAAGIAARLCRRPGPGARGSGYEHEPAG